MKILFLQNKKGSSLTVSLSLSGICLGKTIPTIQISYFENGNKNLKNGQTFLSEWSSKIWEDQGQRKIWVDENLGCQSLVR